MFVSYVALVARCWLMLLTVQRESHPCWIRTHWSASSSPQLFLQLPFIRVQLVLCEISVLISCLSVCRWVSFLIPLKTKCFLGENKVSESAYWFFIWLFSLTVVSFHCYLQKKDVWSDYRSLKGSVGFMLRVGGHCNVFCWTSRWESATLACQDPVSRLKCPLVTRGAL